MKAPEVLSLRIVTLLACLLASTIALAGCSGSSGSNMLGGQGRGGGPGPSPPPSRFIKHVVVMVQENRSFDNFFATFPGADGARSGVMQTSHGDIRVHLEEASFSSDELGHDHVSFQRELDGGKMDGFGLVARKLPGGTRVPAGTYAYRVVAPQYIAPYWTIAHQYVLGDHMFMTQGSSSFTAHQDLIAGGTPIGRNGDNVIDFPTPPFWGCDAPPGTVTSLITSNGSYLFDRGPFPCFTYPTLRDLLDARRVSWRYFTNTSSSSVWNAFDAVAAVRQGPEWSTNVVRPPTAIFNAIAGRKLPAVSWVIPNAGESDHPGFDYGHGPAWIASVVNAIGESPYWSSTVVIVVWDDWGGEYDHAAPPQLDGQGLGMRVPMLLVSAYAREAVAGRPGYISHTQYEFGSIVKFIEDIWSLGQLGTTDYRANSLIDCFDFSQAPRPFTRIPSTYSKSYFEREPPSRLPVDTY
jgi:phospholipase C